MGWIATSKPRDIAAHFKERMQSAQPGRVTYRVLDLALLDHATEGYVAIEETDQRTGHVRVGAVILQIRHIPNAADGLTFAYKQVSESAGPQQTRCPERILDRLSPTDSADAMAWRAACRERHAARAAARKIGWGDIIAFDAPIELADGRRYARFALLAKSRFFAIEPTGVIGPCVVLSRWRERGDWKKDGHTDLPVRPRLRRRR
ncbi:DUF6927 domain-containing protein [Rhodovibrio sodomensis]|uniref:DUF6927 domain-containing protein n=1 Tax=Rhodovibrio sodomensis TaxID=1088 RepID=UPI001908B830|nr:hypothetical protein [Rhodovibrio sodomensis]